MLEIIKALLNLWDPYKIYMFPEDEYLSEAREIEELIEHHKLIEKEELANAVYSILPPITDGDSSKLNEQIAKIEYERFAELILLIFKKMNTTL